MLRRLIHVGHKISAFGVHDDGMLTPISFFDRREHLGAQRVHQKMPADDNHPKKTSTIF